MEGWITEVLLLSSSLNQKKVIYLYPDHTVPYYPHELHAIAKYLTHRASFVVGHILYFSSIHKSQ